MTHIGTEKLPLFADGPILPGPPIHDLGETLKKQALKGHTERHGEDIQKVRVALLAACTMGNLTTLTGDDVMAVVEQMGIPGDPRWTACVLKGWDKVQPTDQFVPSRRPSRHSAPIRVWSLR